MTIESQTQSIAPPSSAFAPAGTTQGAQEHAPAAPGPALIGQGAGGNNAAASQVMAPMFGDAPHAATQAAPAAAGSGPGWMTIIPDAQGTGSLTSINRTFDKTGHLTGVSLGYGKGVHAAGTPAPAAAPAPAHEAPHAAAPPSAAAASSTPTPGEAPAAASPVDEACQAIATARAGLQARTELRLVNFKQKTRKGTVQEGGYAYIPSHTGKAEPGSLLEWLRTATPTAAQKNPQVQKQWEVYKHFLAWEGLPSAINAYDSANITWGTGFAAGGQLEQVMAKFFAKDAAAEQDFFAAGIALSGGKFVAVDPDKKWKVHGTDAAHLIATDARLLSMFMNISEGVALNDSDKTQPADHRQAALDAQFETFQAHAGNAPPDILGSWQTYPLALAAHAQHFAPGWFNWNGFRSTNGDIAQIKAIITQKAGPQATYIILPDTQL